MNKKLNPHGFNCAFIHRNGTKYDDQGYDILGFDRDGYNRDGKRFQDVPAKEIVAYVGEWE